MRRVLFWYLPLGAALLSATVFGAGFWSYLTGRTGTSISNADPVDAAGKANTAGSASGAATKSGAARPVIQPLIIGDSLARGAGDESGLGIGGRLDEELRTRKFPAQRTVNLGLNGARTADLLRQLETANVKRLIGEANVLIVSIGGNDLWSGGIDWRNAPPENPDKVMDQVLDRIEKAVRLIRNANPRARIMFVGLYNPFSTTKFGPRLSALVNRWNGKLLDRFGDDPNFTLVQTADIFTHHDRLSLDRFHPGAEGYALIARRIADGL
jgi:lysophospholipase L1-like esterase